MRPVDSVTGTRCTRCTPPSYLSVEIGALAADLERDLLVAAVVVLVRREDLDREALGLRVARVHARQLAGEDAGLVAAGAGADLDDHVLGVVRVAGEGIGADLLGELVEQPAAVDELLLGHLAQLVVAVGLGRQQRLGLVGGAPRLAVAHARGRATACSSAWRRATPRSAPGRRARPGRRAAR